MKCYKGSNLWRSPISAGRERSLLFDRSSRLRFWQRGNQLMMSRVCALPGGGRWREGCERVSCRWGREQSGAAVARGLETGSWSSLWSPTRAMMWSFLPPPDKQRDGWGKSSDFFMTLPPLGWGCGGCGFCRGVQAPSQPALRPSSTRTLIVMKGFLSRSSWSSQNIIGVTSLYQGSTTILVFRVPRRQENQSSWSHYHNHLGGYKVTCPSDFGGLYGYCPSSEFGRGGWQPGAAPAQLSWTSTHQCTSSEILTSENTNKSTKILYISTTTHAIADLSHKKCCLY